MDMFVVIYLHLRGSAHTKQFCTRNFVQEEQAWSAAVAKSSDAFLKDRTNQFVKEFHFFIASGMSLTAYDSHTGTAKQGEKRSSFRDADLHQNLCITVMFSDEAL